MSVVKAIVKTVSNFIHHFLSKSKFLTQVAILARNQCNCVIRYHITDSSDPEKNGEKFIINSISKYCNLIIDIGANKGEWTNYFLDKNPEIRAFLFEPSVNAFNFLQERFRNFKNITLINKAAGDFEGETQFFEEPDSGETSSLIKSFSSKVSVEKKIMLTTLDQFASTFNILKINFLKIDAEGYDLHVLKGCKELLKFKKIDFIQFEYNSPWAQCGSTLFDAINLLHQYDYEILLIQKNALYFFDYTKYGEFYGYSNFFALPASSLCKVKDFLHGII